MRGTRLDNYRLYMFKKKKKEYTMCHAGFCRIITALSRVLKDVDIISSPEPKAHKVSL